MKKGRRGRGKYGRGERLKKEGRKERGGRLCSAVDVVVVELMLNVLRCHLTY